MQKIWAPGHVTAFFTPGRSQRAVVDDYSQELDGPKFDARALLDALESIGSVGAGFSLDIGAETRVEERKKYPLAASCGEIRIYSETWGRTSDIMLRLLSSFYQGRPTDVSLHTSFSAPLGSGLGMSASAVVGQCAGLVRLLDLDLAKEEVLGIAHASEVLASTGLGDVAALGRGLEIRERPGLPPKGEITSVVCRRPVTVIHLGRGLPTSGVLNDEAKVQKIRIHGHKALLGMLAGPMTEENIISELVRLGRDFSEATGLLNARLSHLLTALDRAEIPASMVMLGNSAFSFAPSPDMVQALEYADIEADIMQGRVYRGPPFVVRE